MSSEVCPFCGKTYKRLKSHLPHCKAAGSSKTPPTKHDAAANQTLSSSQLAAASSEPKVKEKKSTRTLPVTASLQSKKSTKIPSVSSVPTSLSQPTDPSSVSSSSLTKKKKKEKLSEQIKMANIISSTSLSSSPPLSSFNISEPKRTSLRALIEAAKSEQVLVGSGEGTRSASGDLPSASAPLGTESVNSRTKIQKETKTTETALIKDTSHPVFLSKDSKPKGASKMKATRTKKTIPSLLTINETSRDSKVNEGTAESHFREWGEKDEEGTDLSVSKTFSKSESSQPVRITLQDVKTILGRANNHPHNKSSILSQIQTDDLSSKIRPAFPSRHQESNLALTQALSDRPSSNSSQNTELQSADRKSSKQVTLTPPQHPQPGLNSPGASVLSGYLSSQVNKATPTLPKVRVIEESKAGQRHTGLLSTSPSVAQFSSPHTLRLSPQFLPAREEMLRVEDGSQQEVRRQHGAEGALTERSLGQVRLRELPEWLACKSPSHPRDVVHMVQRGWQWYYRRYIDVKKGGVGGVGMLLAGYCVLSYIWSYPHIKCDRWRKHH